MTTFLNMEIPFSLVQEGLTKKKLKKENVYDIVEKQNPVGVLKDFLL